MRELKQDWRDIFLAFRIARDPRKVVAGMMGVILSLVLIYTMAWTFHKIQVIHEAPSGIVRDCTMAFLSHPCTAVRMAIEGAPHKYRPQAVIFLVVMSVGLLVIWSFAGGIITRIAAVEVAKDERIEFREARKFACRKYWAYLWAPLVPAVGIAFFGFWVIVGGLVNIIPVLGNLLIGLFFPLALLMGFMIALIVIGGVAGGGMMMPAISAEGTDAFDGISRAYSYVYSRPWRFIFYCALAIGYALLCAAFVYIFTWLTIESTFVAGKIGMKGLYGGRTFEDIYKFYQEWGFYDHPKVHWHADAAAVMIGIYTHVLWALAWGFIASLFFTCNTIKYFLMRKAVDGTEMTEVFTEEEELAAEEPVPAAPKVEAPATEEKKEGDDAAEDEKKKAARKKKEGEE